MPRRLIFLLVGSLVLLLVGVLAWRRTVPSSGRNVPNPEVRSVATAPTPREEERLQGNTAVRKRSVPKLVVSRQPKVPPRFQPKASRLFEREKKNPAFYYEREKRDPVWASAMERLLKERLVEMAAEQRTPGFKADSIDCRESTCRLEVSYGDADVQVAHSQGAVDPLLLGRRDNGPLAAFTYLENAPPAFRRSVDPKAWIHPDGTIKKKVVLIFGEDDIDPIRYRDATAKRGE